jgi:taurine transport system substrate-binding protein
VTWQLHTRAGFLVRLFAIVLPCLCAWCPAALSQQAGRTPDKSGQALRSITSGHVRHVIGPWSTRIADGGFDAATGRTIRWLPFDTDSAVLAAIAAGRLDIGTVGIAVAAAAIARGLELRIFYVLGASADAESLVIDADGSLRLGDAKSLLGKVIAVPFGSSQHFRLLGSLKRWGSNPQAMRIVNLQVPQILSAWHGRDIDAAVVTEPLIGKLGERGVKLPLPVTGEHTGLMVLVTTAEFLAHHGVLLTRLVDLLSRTNESSSGQQAPDSPQVRAIAMATGLEPAIVAGTLDRYRPPPLVEQAGPRWLGGGASAGLVAHLKAGLDLWRWAGRHTGKDPDLASTVVAEPATTALSYR